MSGKFVVLSSPFMFGDKQVELSDHLKQVPTLADNCLETDLIVVSLLPDEISVFGQGTIAIVILEE